MTDQRFNRVPTADYIHDLPKPEDDANTGAVPLANLHATGMVGKISYTFGPRVESPSGAEHENHAADLLNALEQALRTVREDAKPEAEPDTPEQQAVRETNEDEPEAGTGQTVREGEADAAQGERDEGNPVNPEANAETSPRLPQASPLIMPRDPEPEPPTEPEPVPDAMAFETADAETFEAQSEAEPEPLVEPFPLAPQASDNDLPDYEEFCAQQDVKRSSPPYRDAGGQDNCVQIPESIHLQVGTEAGVSGRVSSRHVVGGMAAIALIGFIGLYAVALPDGGNKPADRASSLNGVLPASVTGTATPSDDPADTHATSATDARPPGDQSVPSSPLVTPVRVSSVAIRANPQLVVSAVQGEAGSDILLPFRVSPRPGETVSIVIAGLPEGAALSTGVESSRGVWVVQPGDLAATALRTPIGLSGQYDLDVELLSAEGATLDRKSVHMTLRSGQSGTVPVMNASLGDNGRTNDSGGANPATRTATPHAADAATEDAIADTVITTAADPSLPVQTWMRRLDASGPLFSAYSSGSLPDNPIASGPALKLPDAQTDDLQSLIQQGDRYLSEGNVIPAQKLYTRAMEKGDAHAIMRLAMTYDPVYLSARGIRGVRSDPAMALDLYDKAAHMGVAEAERRRAALMTRLATNN